MISNQKACLKSYIDMKTELRKKTKNDFEKDFLKLMKNVFFGTTMENVRSHRDMKLVTTEARKSYLVSKTNYHISYNNLSYKFFSHYLLTIETKRTQILIVALYETKYIEHYLVSINEIVC